MGLYSAGNAYLQVTPSFSGIRDAMRAEVAKMGRDFDGLAEALPKAFDKASTRMEKQGKRAGEEFSGAFATTFRKRAEEAAKALGDIEPEIKGDRFKSALNDMRRAFGDLSKTKIDVDFDADTAERVIEGLGERLRHLEQNAPDVASLLNLNKAREQVEAFGKTVGQAREQAGQAGQQAGDRFAGGLAQRIQSGVTRALQQLPEYRITADSTPAQIEIERLRERLLSLSQAHIGVDVSTAEALAELNAVQAELNKLDSDDANVDVSVNAGLAAAELAGILELANRVDGKDATVDAKVKDDASKSLREIANESGVTLSRLSLLVSTAASLGPALIPVAAAGAVALSGLATAAGAALAGLGVVAIAMNGVIDAVKSMDAAQKDADKTAKSFAQSQNAIASAQDSLSSAQRSLAQTRENIAERERQTHERIAEAVQAVGRARTEAARSVRDATISATDAQRDYTLAQADAQQARRDLNEAIREAVRDLADLNSSVKRNALDQREAVLEEKKAREDLQKFLANPRATEDEREQARITFERRILQIEDLKRKGQELAEQQAEANANGVNGSKRVQQAQDRVAAADRRVEAAGQRTQRAQEDLVRARLDGAEKIQKAIKQEADARHQAQVDERQAQFQLANAQQSLAAAQRNLAQAQANAATAGGDALDTMRDKLAALSPAGQHFAKFLFSLKGQWDKLQAAAQEGLFPGLERGIAKLATDKRIEGLANFIFRVAQAVGNLFDRAVDQLKDPVWQAFGKMISEDTVPALEGMFEIASNIARGVAALILALSGFNADIGNGLVGLSESFANWATELPTNKGFQDFIAYVRANGPTVVDLIKQVAEFIGHVVVAAAPIGTKVVEGLTKMFELLNRIPTDDLTLLIGTLGALAAALVVVSAVTALVTTGIAGLIAATVVIVVAELVYAYKHFAFFRNGINAVAAAAVSLWQDVLVPAFTGIGQAASYLWTNYLSPFFQVLKTGFTTIGGLISYFYTEIFQPIFRGIAWLLTNIVGPTFSFLWTKFVRPTLSFIGVGLSILGAGFKVLMGVVQIVVKIVGGLIVGLYTGFFKPTWDLIKTGVAWLADFWEKHLKSKWQAGVDTLGKIFDKLREKVKEPIRIIVNKVLNEGLLLGYNKIAEFFHVEPHDVKIKLPDGFRRGGRIDGPGTTTSDSILIRASPGEHMWTAEEVQAAGGHGAVAAMRQSVLGGWVPGFANGGPIGDGFGDWLKKTAKTLGRKATDAFDNTADFLRNPAESLRQLAGGLIAQVPGADAPAVKVILGMPKRITDIVIDKVKGLIGFGPNRDDPPAGMGNSNGLGGSAGMMRILRAVFPGLALISGYRPGSRTLSGNLSYHASDRAVDLPARRDVAQWIWSHFGSSTKELISPWRDLMLWNGKFHKYDTSIEAQHGVFGSNAHVHWAYDQGGWLSPGVTQAVNGTGRPEAVLTNRQWRDMHALAAGASGGGNNYNFEFRDTTLDASKFRAYQDREAAMARAGRAR